MKWVVEILSFAIDLVPISAVAKSCNATVAALVVSRHHQSPRLRRQIETLAVVETGRIVGLIFLEIYREETRCIISKSGVDLDWNKYSILHIIK
jgi:hypothetical protein